MSEKNIFTCDFCDKEFANKTNYYKHIKYLCSVKLANEKKKSIDAQNEIKLQCEKIIEKLETETKRIKEKLEKKLDSIKHKYALKSSECDNLKKELNITKDKLEMKNNELISVLSKNKIGKTISTRKALPKKVREMVWTTYIGKEEGTSKCACCKKTDIDQMNFHCGHVISANDGGSDKIDNLRPICASCNLSMGTQNMDDFIKKYMSNTNL
jgi:hypothetical protein